MVPLITSKQMDMITIKVFLNHDAASTNSRVLERRINWDSSLRFPMEETLKVMKALYGSDAVVQFTFD